MHPRLAGFAVAVVFCSATASVAQAQTLAMEGASSDRVLDSAVVHAPGPGLWQVHKGDHTLWILGTVSPLPAGMAWNATKVRAVVMQADEVIGAPSITVGADIGFFGKLALLPSLIGVRGNPGGKSLRESLPEPTYARWLRLKQRHLGRAASVEQWRPIFAGMELYQAAIKRQGLSGRGVVHEQLAGAMKTRGLKAVDVSARTKVANPRGAVREFKASGFADAECFSKTLDRVEYELPLLAARAQAWASGDVAALAALREPSPDDVCQRAMLGGQFGAKYGIDTLEAKSRVKWVAEAESSLLRNRTTFAVLPMHDVLSTNGLVAMLAQKGYRVEAPAANAADAEAAAPVR